MTAPAPPSPRFGMLIVALLIAAGAIGVLLFSFLVLLFGFPLMDGKSSEVQALILLGLLAGPSAALLALALSLRAAILALRSPERRLGRGLLIAMAAMVAAFLVQIGTLGGS